MAKIMASKKQSSAPQRAAKIVLFCFGLIHFSLWAATPTTPPAPSASVGTVTHLAGILSAQKMGGMTRVLAINSEIGEGDILSTEKETFARLKFIDGSEIVLRPDSQIKIEKFSFSEPAPEKDGAIMSMIRGGFRAVSGIMGKRNQDNVRFNTPTSTIGIRGTHFGALYCQGDCQSIKLPSGQIPADGLHVDVATGSVVVSNKAGSVLVGTGQFGFASMNTAPKIIPPQQGIRVGMPAAISRNEAAGKSTNSGDCVAQ